jgi:hypothetical protein
VVVFVKTDAALAPIAGGLDPGATVAALFDEMFAQELDRVVFGCCVGDLAG